MKIITIPDLHGKDYWQDINPDNYDKMVFLGDYVDAPYKEIEDAARIDIENTKIIINDRLGKTNGEMIYNLNNIIELKNKYPDKVILLLGNHDVPYLYHLKNKSLQKIMMCSGYRISIENEIANLFYSNIKKFNVAYQYGDCMWSHAGITPSAYNAYFKNRLNDNFDIFAEELNKYFILDDRDLFRISITRGGSSEYGSVFWADINEWKNDRNEYIFPFTQIVGHSHVDDIMFLYDDKTFTNKEHLIKKNVIFTDMLNKETKFLEMDL